jgi:hypothetical protein
VIDGQTGGSAVTLDSRVIRHAGIDSVRTSERVDVTSNAAGGDDRVETGTQKLVVVAA